MNFQQIQALFPAAKHPRRPSAPAGFFRKNTISRCAQPHPGVYTLDDAANNVTLIYWQEKGRWWGAHAPI